MAINSRDKGQRGERELAKVLREHGYDSHRGQQFKGGSDSPDVTGIEGFHIECKRTEKTDIYGWMEQANRDAGDLIPVVMHRKNNRGWVCILSLENFIEMERKCHVDS